MLSRLKPTETALSNSAILSRQHRNNLRNLISLALMSGAHLPNKAVVFLCS